jgi:hypothetical protein
LLELPAVIIGAVVFEREFQVQSRLPVGCS